MARGHNEKTQQELYEDQQFLKAFTEVKSLDSTMAGTKGNLSALYKRLKDIGWTKKDFDFAKSLQDKDVGQVIADFERKIRIAKLFGHALGRQLDFLDQDRTPMVDRAFEEGAAAGRLRQEMSNPYQPGSEEHNSWQSGFNEGNTFINKDLAKAISDPLTGEADEDGSDEDETDDEDGDD
ncbi:hypothetical protein [Roseibium sp.]|jgi:hypothetical protein|uniref:hypothetical protein n=1 Tax=Roseibium sp. TaxID=1936156 RepID=UPI003BA9F6CC